MIRKALAVAALVPAIGVAVAAPAFASDGPRPARVNASHNVTVSNNGQSLTATVYLRCDGGGLGRWGVQVARVLQQPGYPVMSRYSFDSFNGPQAITCNNVEVTKTITMPLTGGTGLKPGADQTSLYVQIRPAHESGKSLTTPVTVRG